MTDTQTPETHRLVDEASGDVWFITWGEGLIVPFGAPPKRTLRKRLGSQLRWRISEAVIETEAEIDWCIRRLTALSEWLSRLAYRIRWGRD